jgi:hypothetical protein
VLGVAGAAIEQTFSALKNLLLLGEGRIKRQTGRPLHQERQIRIIEPVECGGNAMAPNRL